MGPTGIRRTNNSWAAGRTNCREGLETRRDFYYRKIEQAGEQSWDSTHCASQEWFPITRRKALMNLHYSRLAESLIEFALSRSNAATELMHSGLIGRAREIFAKDLLTPFLSPNLGVCTGIVVDSHGGSSRQIDVIIYDKTLIPSLMFTGEDGVVPDRVRFGLDRSQEHTNTRRVAEGG